MGVPEQNIGPFEARGFDKTSPAGGGQAVALAPVTATHDAVDRTGILDSQFSGHNGKVGPIALVTNIKNRPPSLSPISLSLS